MKLDDIMKSIEADSNLDKAALDDEALKIPKLHSKYYRIYVDEFKILKGIELEYAELKRQKMEYYLGKSEDKVYKEKPLDHKILRQDLDVYMESDRELQELYGKKCLQEEKLKMVESFIKSLVGRGFNIKSAQEFLRFKNGG